VGQIVPAFLICGGEKKKRGKSWRLERTGAVWLEPLMAGRVAAAFLTRFGSRGKENASKNFDGFLLFPFTHSQAGSFICVGSKPHHNHPLPALFTGLRR